MFPIHATTQKDPIMSATTIDNVRVLLQSLPAAAVNSATQPGDLQTPGKIAAPATPLRAKNPAQLQIMPEKVEEMPPSPPEEFWRDLQQFHERRG